ncbi:DNA helicase [Sarracenia purpurea var. burkii]
MDDQELDVEKARLLSLALDFGFDEESSKKCLDRLVHLYGDDGQDFITVEHCGDDFLAALAESMQDSEDWDDLQAMESEACGNLSDIFDKDIFNNHEEEEDNNGIARSNVHVVEDYPKSEEHQSLMQVDSSSDSEELDFIIPSKRDVGSTPSSCTNWSGHPLVQSSHEHASKSVVRVLANTSNLLFPLLVKCEDSM